jgi:hypothetical protein
MQNYQNPFFGMLSLLIITIVQATELIQNLFSSQWNALFTDSLQSARLILVLKTPAVTFDLRFLIKCLLFFCKNNVWVYLVHNIVVAHVAKCHPGTAMVFLVIKRWHCRLSGLRHWTCCTTCFVLYSVFVPWQSSVFSETLSHDIHYLCIQQFFLTLWNSVKCCSLLVALNNFQH